MKQAVTGPIGASWEETGDLEACGGLSGHDGGPCWRTNCCGGVGVGEPFAFGRQPVDVWGVMSGAPVHAKVIDAEVVGHDEDDVGTGWLRRDGSCQYVGHGARAED